MGVYSSEVEIGRVRYILGYGREVIVRFDAELLYGMMPGVMGSLRSTNSGF